MKAKLIVLALWTGAGAFAQNPNPTIYPIVKEAPDTSRIGKRGIGAYFSQLGTYANPGAINARLRGADYPELGSVQLFWGGGVQYRIGDLQLGMDMAHTINPFGPRGDETSLVRRSALIMDFNVSYTVFRPLDDVSFYPFLGVGGTETNLTLTRSTPDANFEEIIRQPGNAVSLMHFQPYVNIGVGIDAMRRNLGGGLLVSVRTGFRLGGPSAWYSDYVNLDRPPLDQMSRFYAQMSIGYNYNWLSKRQK